VSHPLSAFSKFRDVCPEAGANNRGTHGGSRRNWLESSVVGTIFEDLLNGSLGAIFSVDAIYASLNQP
jgi:hypothetical protein